MKTSLFLLLALTTIIGHAQTNIPPTKVQNLWSMDNTLSRMVYCVIRNGEQKVVCVENKTNLLWEVVGDGEFVDHRPAFGTISVVRSSPVPGPNETNAVGNIVGTFVPGKVTNTLQTVKFGGKLFIEATPEQIKSCQQ